MSAQQDRAAKRPRVVDSNNRIIELNVGGNRFSTTRETLLSKGSPYFRRLLGTAEGEDGIQVSGAVLSGDGSLFIDRNGELFGKILTYLRGTPNVEDLIDNTKQRNLLRAEAQYYQLEDLYNELLPLNQANDENGLSDQDRFLRDTEAQARKDLLNLHKLLRRQGRELRTAQVMARQPFVAQQPFPPSSVRPQGLPVYRPISQVPGGVVVGGGAPMIPDISGFQSSRAQGHKQVPQQVHLKPPPGGYVKSLKRSDLEQCSAADAGQWLDRLGIPRGRGKERRLQKLRDFFSTKEDGYVLYMRRDLQPDGR